MDIFKSTSGKANTYTCTQKVAVTDDEIIITAKMKIKRNSKDLNRIIDKAVKKDESPLVTVLKENESVFRAEKKEGKRSEDSELYGLSAYKN